jgi:hypothetical protein
MVNTRSKGRKFEILAKKELEAQGYLVHLCDMPHRWKLQQDIFGLFDIIALNKLVNENILFPACFKKYVQVKYNDSWKKKTLTGLKQFKDKWLSPDDQVELWNYKKGKGWEVIAV